MFKIMSQVSLGRYIFKILLMVVHIFACGSYVCSLYNIVSSTMSSVGRRRKLLLLKQWFAHVLHFYGLLLSTVFETAFAYLRITKCFSSHVQWTTIYLKDMLVTAFNSFKKRSYSHV